MRAFARSIVWSITLAGLALAVGLPLRAAQTERLPAPGVPDQSMGRLQSLQREADRLAAEERTLLGDLRRLDLERQIRNEELARLEAASAAVDQELADLSAQLARLREQERADRPLFEARLVEFYKLGRVRYLRLLLSTSDARRFGRAARMVSGLATQDRDRLADHARQRLALERQQAAVQDRSDRAESLRATAVRARNAAEQAVGARTRLIQQIDQQRDLNAQLTGELQTAHEKLQATVRTLSSAAPVSALLPFDASRGDLAWPADGPVRVRFGAREGRQLPATGVVIAAREGSVVRAVHDGTVVFAGPFAGYGNLLIVAHGGQNFSLYGHLLRTDVARDAQVEHGRALGVVGSAPTGPPGLYFELRVDGRPVDPIQWLKKR
jgi:septal ring factor EnvC (AmiA/AmiB activator)